MTLWRIYQGVDQPHDRIADLPPPPPWREFDGGRDGTLAAVDRDAVGGGRRRLPRRAAYRADERTVDAVNTALYLRRPLLVSGDPGVGKSTLADAVARELRLGPVLRWSVNSRTTLRDGLYRYDSLGRLEDAGLARHQSDAPAGAPAATDLGRYVSLGPLGTALAPYALPRVLLVDEIDKGDLDLPNDLLDVFEEGGFEIPELTRAADQQPTVAVRPHDGGPAVRVTRGAVQCRAFPFVILTSNGEREFPPAFLRRCIRLHLPSAHQDGARLRAIVEAHLPGAGAAAEAAVGAFLARAATGELATDQLLNAVYLLAPSAGATGPDRDHLLDLVMQHLNDAPPGRP
ncbi:AAA family ATPase [Kitasatospora fiedleri]|uniref:AAA family ATPase n=1 Tax=Kitasatospora fiedleri TaxID=2991545 RepID=UPI00249B6D24|nr:AAA family ATPase [Kitasatospora fiedleri]